MPVQFGRMEIQSTVRDVVKDKREVSCECTELRSSSASWSRSKIMLGEQGASRRGNPGLVSPSTARHLKLVIGSVQGGFEISKGHTEIGIPRTNPNYEKK